LKLAFDLPQPGTGNLVDDAVESLRKKILSGDLAAGDELPSQGDLCAELGVSRSVIREAMKVLESGGLIEISQGRRPRILPASPAAVIETLQTLMERSELSLLALVEMRRPLEIEIAGHAAERLTSSQADQLCEAVEALREAPDFESEIAADMRFHKVLAEATGNPLFGIVLDVLAQLLHSSRRQTLQHSGREMALAYHQRICDAVCRRDPAAARELMAQHMEQTRKDLIEATGERRVSTP
jgi:GntR family transcriptional repressor for pyruvate dehydrogenase complex